MLSIAKKDKIHYTENWFWLPLWYLQTLLTTKLEFRIYDISVEFGVHICQQIVLSKKKHYLKHILSYNEHIFLWIILSETHRVCKFGTPLKVLSSITDSSLWSNHLLIVNICLFLIKSVTFCSVLSNTHIKILCNFEFFNKMYL